MVVGAGRGPLVRRALAAARAAHRMIKVYAVEKNPNAVVTLQAQQDEDWGDQVPNIQYYLLCLSHHNYIICNCLQFILCFYLVFLFKAFNSLLLFSYR